MSQASDNEQFQISNLYDVKDRVVIVTGGGSGIGLMTAQAFAVNGAKVYIIGRNKDKLDTVVKEYGQNIAGQIIALPGDVTDKADIARMYDEISSKEKCVCVLVNNAGINSATLETDAKTAQEAKQNLFDPEESNMEDWISSYQTNVPSCYFMTFGFLPLLEAATKHHHGYSGCVINVSSISGIVKTPQHHYAYNCSKAAVIALTKMTSSELARNNIPIRVNTLAPGVFPSEMTTDGSDGLQKSQIPKENFEGKVPANRPGTDKDMAQGMLYLATNQYVNGTTLVIDGGYVVKYGSA